MYKFAKSVYKYAYMKTRTQRLLAIRRIIENDKVSSQEELLGKVVKKGFRATQATLSRDLKFLGVAKVPDQRRGYVYRLPANGNNQANLLSHENFPVNGFLSIEFAWNLGVIKTLPGYANSIAWSIDHLDAFEILGTVAGDDTILIIPREDVNREDVLNALVQLIPALAEKV